MKKNIILTVLVSSLISVAVFFVGNYFINLKNSSNETSYVDFNENHTIIAGVIRNKGDGWKLIQDAGHETIGITRVSQDEEKVTIFYNEATKVNSIAVTLDETMTSEGYSTGASVGLDQARIFIYDKNGNLTNPDDYVSNYGNIWIQGVFKK